MKKKVLLVAVLLIVLISAMSVTSMLDEDILGNVDVLATSSPGNDPLPSLIAVEKLVGKAVGIYNFATKVIQTLKGAVDESDQKPSVEITQLDVSTQNLIVGDTFEVVGRARVRLGNTADVHWAVDYQDTYVTVKLILGSKKQELEYIFSSVTKAADFTGRYWRWSDKNQRPNNLFMAEDEQDLELEFRFIVEALNETITDPESVEVEVTVKGPEGDPWGRDPIVTKNASRTKPFMVRKEFEVSIDLDKNEVNHIEAPNVKAEMKVKNLSSQPLTVVYARVGGRIKTKVTLKTNEERTIVIDVHPHTGPHCKAGTIRDAIVIEPIHLITVLELPKTGTVHTHDETYEKFTADCHSHQPAEAHPYEPDPDPKVTIPEAKKDPVVNGTVVDSVSGKPLDGINATMRSFFVEPDVSTLTDIKGYFSFNVDNETLWVLSLSHEGYEDLYSVVSVFDDVDLGVLTLDRRHHFINGTITDGLMPVSAIVRLEGQNATYLTNTNPLSGNFTLPNIPYGEHGVIKVISYDPPPLTDFRYFCNFTKTVTIKENLDLGDILLQPQIPTSPYALISGTVSDQNYTTPIVNALVEVVNAETGLVMTSVTTDANGNWSTTVQTGLEIKLRVSWQDIGLMYTPAITIIKDLYIHDMYLPIPVHDIAVTDVTSFKTVVGQGYSVSINVTVANQGDYTETFNVTAYANTTEIETREITLTSANSTTLTFTWNTTGFAYGSYTISAYATPVPGETDTADNTLVDGSVFVSHPRCFIATAAYGTPMAKEVQILREFRDEYLLTNPVGRALVDVYYRVSPPMAEFITQHPSLKPIVRAGLLLAVAMSAVVVNTTPAEKVVVISLLALVSVALAVWAKRRRSGGPEHTRG